VPKTPYIFAAILISAISDAITWALRAAPFAFIAPMPRSAVLPYLNEYMPPGIMVILVFYTIRSTPLSITPLTVSVAAGLHLWRSNATMRSRWNSGKRGPGIYPSSLVLTTVLYSGVSHFLGTGTGTALLGPPLVACSRLVQGREPRFFPRVAGNGFTSARRICAGNMTESGSECPEPYWLMRMRQAAKQRPKTRFVKIRWLELQYLRRERDALWLAAGGHCSDRS
jgi:branched-subunit amino acid transport protein AzlD